MSTINQARFPEDRQYIEQLFKELAQFLYDNIYQRFGEGFDIEELVSGWMAQSHEFFHPKGYLVLASVDSEVVGVGGLRTIGENLGEIKHFYVRPRFRRCGLGRDMLNALLEHSLSIGHTVLRLDTGWFMEAAQALYHSFGFQDISPYLESEVPKEIYPFWVFMEKDLIAQT
jgi:ribosomal protein S18 acetylase RimI-like enzyme